MDSSVTIITPTYQRYDELKRAIYSLQAQTHKGWKQLICVDGGYDANAEKVVKHCADERIELSYADKHYNDYGYSIRNNLLKQVDTEYVCFLDDDNIFMPTYLEKMVGILRRTRNLLPKYGFVICHCLHFGPLNHGEVGKPPQVLTGVPPKLYHIDLSQVVVRTEIMQELTFGEPGYFSDGKTFEKMGEIANNLEVQEVLAVHL